MFLPLLPSFKPSVLRCLLTVALSFFMSFVQLVFAQSNTLDLAKDRGAYCIRIQHKFYSGHKYFSPQGCSIYTLPDTLPFSGVVLHDSIFKDRAGKVISKKVGRYVATQGAFVAGVTTFYKSDTKGEHPAFWRLKEQSFDATGAQEQFYYPSGQLEKETRTIHQKWHSYSTVSTFTPEGIMTGSASLRDKVLEGTSYVLVGDTNALYLTYANGRLSAVQNHQQVLFLNAKHQVITVAEYFELIREAQEEGRFAFNYYLYETDAPVCGIGSIVVFDLPDSKGKKSTAEENIRAALQQRCDSSK